MDILVNVVNQKMKIATNLKNLVSGTQNFVRFTFNLSEDWNGLTVFAQFRQNSVAYNKYLDTNKQCYLPAEIQAGTCTVMLYGSLSSVIATTNYITFTLDEHNLLSNASSTQITQSLYNQLVTLVSTATNWNEQEAADLLLADQNLQSQINTKASQADLTAEINRAKAAEQANAAAIALKASQSQVTLLEAQVNNLAQNEVVESLIEEAVEAEMAEYLSGGQLSSLLIVDGSLARTKVNSAFEATLVKADNSMQKSVYDTQNLGVDVFSYAQARADIVNGRLNVTNAEIQDAYRLSDTVVYTKIGDAVRGAVTMANNYALALLANYEAFNISIVNTLPVVGTARTFYLVPKSSGTGYDKYWYVTNSLGDSSWDKFGGSSTQVVTSLPTTGDADIDYILKSSSGCLYYKYIDGVWRVVAGSIAAVSSTLPTTGNEFTDYYVLNSSGAYIHYRYINGAFRQIGSDTYTQNQITQYFDAVNNSISTTNSNVTALTTRVTSAESNITSLSQTINSVQQSVNNLDVEGLTYYATYDSDHVFTLYEVDGDEETVKSQFTISGGGGGGGGTSTTTLTVERITGSPLVITPTDTANISFTFSSVDGDGEDVDATYTWKLNNTTILSGALVKGTNTFDMTDYCNIGTQKFTLIVTDEGGNTVVKTWNVQLVDVRLESSFSDRITYPTGNSVNFTYTPYGSVTKTVHFILDGVELTSVITSASGTLQSYTLPAQTHGAHLLECFITATINNIQIETDHIYKDIIWYNENSTVPVIGCILRNNYYHIVTNPVAENLDEYYTLSNGVYSKAQYKTVTTPALANISTYYEWINSAYTLTSDVAIDTTATYYVKELTSGVTYYSHKIYTNQYDTTNIAYYVFSPTTSTPTVTLTADGNTSTQTLSTSNNTWAYKSTTTGDKNLVITCGNTSITIQMKVAELDVDISPVTANLAFDFNPTGLSNTSVNRLWVDSSDSTVAMQVSNNFDWSSGGYQLDSDGNQYFCIKAGTTATFSYNLFGTDPKTQGMEFKLIFKTTNVKSADATFFTCLDGYTNSNVGLQMNTHEAYLYSSSDNLYIPYSEEDRIEFEFNINPLDQENQDATAIIMSYEDGVGMRPMIYDSAHRLHQYTPAPIVIGSANCDVHIYRMKAYKSSLTDSNILSNFIADALSADEMIARYNRNQIYDENNNLTPEALANACPDLRIIKIECPQFTNNKSNFVKYTNVQCIYKNGDPVLDNWTFKNCYHSGQGTTSNEYGYAGRNIDIICCMDGVNQYSSKITFDANYKTQLTLGDGTKFENGTGKVSLSRTSVPNNWFNIKVNIASSENANNALLQKRYNTYLPYTSAAEARDPKAKNDMEFYNCVVFVKETGNANGTTVSRREFTDNDWHFYAIGNIGDSKKTDSTRVNDPNDMKEFCIEISDNTLPNAAFQTGVYSNDNGATYNFTGTGSMVYPITEGQWNNANNQKRIALEYSFDGDDDDDHPASFEFRYDLGGETRDGDTTGLSTAEQTAQRARNKEIFKAFYKWVVTSTNSDFVSQLSRWCVQDSMLYWYLFTERYTMIDNRAKNTFWHFGNIGTYRVAPYLSNNLMAYYYEYNSQTETYTLTSDTTVTAGKTYYWKYAFEMWDYDNDTALGINNSGELTMTYGKEDTDYRTAGNASSGYIFNAAESTIWRRIRNLMDSQLRAMYQTLDSSNCWSSESLITQFDEWQGQFPEELWRLDIERKYYRTYRGEGLNAGATPSPTRRFLEEMMNGRKKYQRRQFERDQAAYMGTKYLSSSIMADKIEFRCNTPLSAVVTPNYDLTIVPYSDMYLSVKFGNTNAVQIRATGGQSYTVECPIVGNMDDTMFVIYCASRIQALNDISACYIHDNDFSSAKKLQTLKIGNTTSGYQNNFLTTLNLGSSPLLESLDIRNCPNLVGSLNLSSCVNLTTLRAEGTALTAVTFANYGKISSVYLPNTVNTLVMRNLNYLHSINMSFTNLESFTEENCPYIDEKAIVTTALNTLQNIRLVGINWTLSDTTLLNSILSKTSKYLSGSVYVSGQIRNQELLSYASAWNDLTVTYNSQNLVTQYLATYVNADSNNTVLYQVYVDRGSAPPDPYATGKISLPTLASTAQYTYSFGTFVNNVYTSGSGWSGITDVMLADRTITAVYARTVRTYTVTWYSRAGLSLATTTATYGSEVVYSGNTPTDTTGESTYNYKVFNGWDRSTGFITGDTNVYATWVTAGLPAANKELKDMNIAEIYAVTSTGRSSSYFDDKDYIDIAVGNDYNFKSIASTEHGYVNDAVLKQNTYYNGSTHHDFDIALFDSENPTDFTMLIDFQFTSPSTDDTLVSGGYCYEQAEGFRLRYNTNPQIQWGTNYVTCGVGNNRGVVVVRHNAGSNVLHVYSYNTGVTNETLPNAISYSSVTRSRATDTKQKITLGSIKYSVISDVYDYVATGTIHKCKVWYADLGDSVCRKLVAWPHETWRMEYCGTERYRLSDGSGHKSNASFICNHELRHLHNMNNTNTNANGWDGSLMRTFMNSMLYNALPIGWRSLIKQVRIPATEGSQSTSVKNSNDYIYLPSAIEVSSQSGTGYSDEGTRISWFPNSTGSAGLRCKFRGIATSANARYFSANSDPTAVTSNNVAIGDVWVHTGNSSIGYVLISSDTQKLYNHPIYMTASDGNVWVAANYWWLRSPFTGYATFFWFVSYYGYLGYYDAAGTYGVVPCFSI